jgi:hypothetical protein
MCSRLVKRGMPSDSVERAQRWRRRHLELARTKAARMNVGPAGADASAIGNEGEPTDDDASGDESSAEYRLARAEREQLRAARERLELERLRGQLLDVRELERIGFTTFRAIRDAFENIAPRIAAEVHALAAGGGSVDEVERAIHGQIRDGLTSAAKAIEQLNTGRDEEDDDDGE